MAGGNTETAHKQQPHRHEEQGADADAGRRTIAGAGLPQGEPQGMGAGERQRK
jgi:hypothetical protein